MTAEAHAAPPNPVLNGFRHGLDAIDWASAKIVIASMTIMVVVVAAQVFARYALNLSLDWAEEISRLFFVWSIFFAIPLGVKRGAHVSVSLLTDRLSIPMQDKLYRAMNLLAMLLMGVVAYEAYILTRDQWDEPMSTLDFSIGWFMLPLCIGSVHSFLHLLNGVFAGRPKRQELATE